MTNPLDLSEHDDEEDDWVDMGYGDCPECGEDLKDDDSRCHQCGWEEGGDLDD